MRKKDKLPADGRIWFCPECGKQRMVLPMGQEPRRDKVSMETPSGRKVDIYPDVCSFCNQKYLKKYFGAGRDMKAVADMMKDVHAGEVLDIPDGKSLEELL